MSMMDTRTRGHSEAAVWARGGPPPKSAADEVMRSSASTLLSSGRVARFLDGMEAHSA